MPIIQVWELLTVNHVIYRRMVLQKLDITVHQTIKSVLITKKKISTEYR